MDLSYATPVQRYGIIKWKRYRHDVDGLADFVTGVLWA